MIKKERKIPIIIRKMEALLNRLDESHPKWALVKQEYVKRMAGYKGEKRVDYQLSLLAENRYHIFHSLELPSRSGFFQIDSLLISPFFILIIEDKSIYGTIYFDHTFNQLIRTTDELEEGLTNPIPQVERHKYHFLELLKRRKFKSPPIEPLVVISSPSTVIKTSNPNVRSNQIIIRAENLINKLMEIERKYKDVVFSPKEVNKLGRILLSEHTQPEINILEHFSIKEEDIQKGVQCPCCKKFNMKWSNGKWVCSDCKFVSKDPHQRAAIDYLLFINPTISNKEFCDFTGIESRYTAFRMLKSMDLPSTGNNKGRRYYLDLEE